MLDEQLRQNISMNNRNYVLVFHSLIIILKLPYTVKFERDGGCDMWIILTIFLSTLDKLINTPITLQTSVDRIIKITSTYI